MVRLGDAIHPRTNVVASLVSIPVWFDWEATGKLYMPSFNRFNSSMVRLGAKNNSLPSNRLSCFNSSMVRLGELAVLLPYYCALSFNSSMVRLGDRQNIYCRETIAVSIPVWFDWEECFRRILRDNQQVSIPVWFDWENRFARFMSYRDQVSIPVWFDWECLDEYIPREMYLVSIPVWFDWERHPSRG